MPAGRASNAALVGAKTVNGPSPCRVSTRPAADTAATRVEKSGLPLATATMSPASAAATVVSTLGSSSPQAARTVSATAAAAAMNDLRMESPIRLGGYGPRPLSLRETETHFRPITLNPPGQRFSSKTSVTISAGRPVALEGAPDLADVLAHRVGPRLEQATNHRGTLNHAIGHP